MLIHDETSRTFALVRTQECPVPLHSAGGPPELMAASSSWICESDLPRVSGTYLAVKAIQPVRTAQNGRKESGPDSRFVQHSTSNVVGGMFVLGKSSSIAQGSEAGRESLA